MGAVDCDTDGRMQTVYMAANYCNSEVGLFKSSLSPRLSIGDRSSGDYQQMNFAFDTKTECMETLHLLTEIPFKGPVEITISLKSKSVVAVRRLTKL